jgi:MFS transporter, putative metabolite:H+ symporter
MVEIPRRQQTAPPRSLSLPMRFERLPFTNYQRRLFAVVATAFFFDSLDVTFLTFVLAPVSIDLDLTKSMAGLLASATFAGMGIGASVAGILSDRFGRRPIFAYSMIFWGVFSLLTALSWNFDSLVLFRFLTGIGLGAELPVAQALLSEFLPARRRGWYMGWLPGTITISFLVSGVVSLLLVPSLGWRSVFVLMFVLSLFGLYIRRGVPESPRWYESRGRYDRAETAMGAFEARVTTALGRPLPEPGPAAGAGAAPRSETGPMSELFSERYRRRTLMAWGLWFCGLLGYYAITAWIAKLLVDNGMTVTSSITIVLLMQVWGVPGFLIAARLMERWGRRPIVGLAILLSAGSAYMYGSVTGTVAIVIAGSILQFCLMGMWASIYTYTPELFPTGARATGAGTASAVGRLGALIGPSLVPPALERWGYTATFAIVAALFLVAAALVLAFGPETKGRLLEDVSG